jgi:glycerol-3-phosphate dehydrogenase (NAD(P)+)
MKTKIGVLGLGHFGTAILSYLDQHNDNRFQLMGFDHKQNLCHFLTYYHNHPHCLKNYQFDKNIVFTASYQKLISYNDVVILAVSSNALEIILEEIKPYLKKKIIFVSLIKALNYKTALTPSQIITQKLKGYDFEIAVLVGGSLAHDLVENKILGMNLACQNKETTQKLHNIFHSKNLKIYPSQDMLGLEYASCFKNIISVFAGILKGMNFPYGSITYLISQMAGEIKDICLTQLNCQPETFDISSQCFGNDMWMSATTNSRNSQFGCLIGQGMTPKQALKEMTKEKKIVESLGTLKTMEEITNLKNYPFTYFLNNLIDNNLTNREVEDFLSSL